MSDITETVQAAPESAPPSAPTEYRSRGGDSGGPGGRPRRRYPRRKVCYFTAIKAEYIDYKDGKMLRRFVSDTGKILPRRVTGTCSRWQRALTTAVKRARQLALLPYKSE